MTSDREEEMEEGVQDQMNIQTSGQEQASQPPSEQQQQQTKSKRGGRGQTGQGRKPTNNPEYPCLCCGDNCTKSQAAIKCIMCTLWAHKDCVKMPDTTFKLLEDQIKESGSAYWVCRPCQNFGQRIKKPVRGEQQETDRWNRKRDR
jgi:hypothetical protein